MAEPVASADSRPNRFRNWISWTGLLLSASALFAFGLLFVIDLFAGHPNPYVGVLAYVVAPGFFILGLLIALFGAILQWRRNRRALRAAQPLVIKIDFSRARDRKMLGVFATVAVAFLFLTAVGSYQTYQLTESVQFCGKACHLPMEPQFVAAQHTAHAKVECVACHVGPGAANYLKTKLNGTKQLYHTVMNDFPRPIYVTETNPRPTQAICEQCHWPKKFHGNAVHTYQHYLSDEKNTPFAVRLLLNVGGGDPSNGPQGGIHWHMNIANKIEYIATDDLLMNIPWVRMTNPQGVTTVYSDPDFKDDISKHTIRRMDCMDCHSRPAHKIHTPNEAVDLAMSTGRLDPKIPWLKSKVVGALTKTYATRAEADKGITASLREAYPDRVQADAIIKETLSIYHEDFFPEVKTDWRTHPDFVGHKNWNGCFRCHDGKHVAPDGKMSIKASDCKSCHLIVAQGSGEELNKLNPAGYNFVHIDAEYSEFTCVECHTGGPQR